MVLLPLSYCQTGKALGQGASSIMPGHSFILLEIDFFFPHGAEEKLRSPNAGREGGSDTVKPMENKAELSPPQPQSPARSGCGTYVSDFIVMHSYHQHCPKPVRRAQHWTTTLPTT